MELGSLNGNVIGVIADNYKRDDFKDTLVSEIITKRIEETLKMVKLESSVLEKRFSDLSSTRCYWIDSQYGTDKAFALEKVNDTTSRIYGNDINNSCSIIPVIIVSKSNLNMGN